MKYLNYFFFAGETGTDVGDDHLRTVDDLFRGMYSRKHT